MTQYEDDYFEEDMINAAEMAAHQPRDDDHVLYATGFNKPPRNILIAIEGIDGAGKETLTKALADNLNAKIVSFPSYESSEFAQFAGEALHGRMGDLIDSAHGMALLFALDRSENRHQLDVPGIVLVDRYVASNAAYTVARTRDESQAEWVHALEFGHFDLPAPDLQILVDTPPMEAKNRMSARGTTDAYESDISLQDRVSAEYRRMVESDWVSPWIVTTGDDPHLAELIVNSLKRLGVSDVQDT